jgi:hypothetical protein
MSETIEAITDIVANVLASLAEPICALAHLFSLRV